MGEEGKDDEKGRRGRRGEEGEEKVKGKGIVHCWTRSRHAELECVTQVVSTYCQAVVASLHILPLCAALVTNGIVVLGPPVIVRLLLGVRVRLCAWKCVCKDDRDGLVVSQNFH